VVVPGIELSVLADRGTFHLLGYFGEPAPPALMARMDEIASSRERRNAQILARLAALGVPVAEADVRARATGRVGRPHIAAALVAAGYCADIGEAFDRYLGADAPAYVAAGAFGPEESVRLVKAAGGATSIAHPGSLLLDPVQLGDLVASLVPAGLDAIEAYRGDTPVDEQEAYAALAAQHGLLATGGSDYHGPAMEERGRVLGSCGEPDRLSQPPASFTVWPWARRRSATFSRWSPWISTASPLTAPPDPHSFFRSLATAFKSPGPSPRTTVTTLPPRPPFSRKMRTMPSPAGAAGRRRRSPVRRRSPPSVE
jgi:predicted metal-dependent phosphoesterase TrpH